MATFPPPLDPYNAPFKPLTNITPFTYRDGWTYVRVLEEFRHYITDVVVPYVNTNFTELGDDFEQQVNTLIDTVNAQLAAQTVSVEEAIAELEASVTSKLIGITAGTNVVVSTATPGSPTSPVINVPGDTSPTPNTLMARDGSGRSQVVSPSAAADVATKGYVDALTAGGEAGVTTVVAGAHIAVNSTDAHNPIVSATGLVSSVATPSVAHVTDGSGAEGSLPYTDAATVSSIVKRDAGGRAKFVDPIDAADVATKGYTDSGDSTLNTSKVDKVGTANHMYGTDGSGNQTTTPVDTAATASTIAKRDAAGALTVAAPTAVGHAATKAYVDAADATKAPQNYYGTYSARPAANTVPNGTLYYASDVPEIYRSNGVSWNVVGPGGNELGSAIQTAAYSAGATEADVTGMTITFRVGERPIYLEYTTFIVQSGSGFVTVYIVLDGVKITAGGTNYSAGGGTVNVGARADQSTSGVTLTPGTTHTAKIRAITSGITGTIGSTTIQSILKVVTL